MQYVVYVILLKEKRLYVGMTKTWRLQKRWEEHCDPNFPTTKWTTKYPPIQKIHVFEQSSMENAKKLEHIICERIMAIFGLDVVRGGRWNMFTEGQRWWPPPHLKQTPFFTEQWLTLSEHTFSQFVVNDPTLCSMPRNLKPISSWRETTSSKLA